MERRDSLGRRIGYNWWREYNVTILRDAEAAWQSLYGTNHQMEHDEFCLIHPRPTLKALLLGNAGMHRQAA